MPKSLPICRGFDMIDQDQQGALRDQILAAVSANKPLLIRGGGTKSFLGETGRAHELLETSGHRGILNYEPTELVLTARAGTPLQLIEQTLAAQKQMLGFEPPHFGAATLGGAVAAGLSGPRRLAAGSCRDFVLGASMLNAKGEYLRFGGEVMKNVAGYDLARLLAGSFGTLGLITEVSIKVIPLPAHTATLMLELNQVDALLKLNQWGGQPLPITASSWFDGQLLLRLEGARAALESATSLLGGERVLDSAATFFWRDLREHKHAFFKDAKLLWRLSVPSTTAALSLPGRQWIEWGGSQRWCGLPACDASQAQQIRRIAQEAGGHATLFRVQDNSADPGIARFHPLAPPVAALHRRLKQQLDPAGIFCPGRMYSDW